jgi:hypothetical protein
MAQMENVVSAQAGTSYNAGNLECSALRILGCLLTAQGICALILAGLT